MFTAKKYSKNGCRDFRNPPQPENPQEYPEMWADFEMLNENAFNKKLKNKVDLKWITMDHEYGKIAGCAWNGYTNSGAKITIHLNQAVLHDQPHSVKRDILAHDTKRKKIKATIHGKNFEEHMKRLNNELNMKITVSHDLLNNKKKPKMNLVK